MKCYRIDEGGERFWYAAETQEAAMAEHRSVFEGEDEYDEMQIRELTNEEMEKVTIDTTDGDNEYPDGKATLKQLFDDEFRAGIDGALQIAASVY